MVWTIDKFVKVFNGEVSDDLLDHQDELVTKEIRRLEKNIADLKTAGIDSGAYEEQVPLLKKRQADAKKEATSELKYAKLESAEKEAERQADNAARSLKIEPAQKDISKLKTLIQNGGTDALDTRIEKLGGKAGSDADKKLVVAAIKARWGLEKLNGDLSSKALPRLYKVMAMVPDDHIKGNTSLKEIRRDRVSDEAPLYDSSDKKIVLNCRKTKDDKYTVTADDGTQREVSHFDMTTLHEIAHAVDDKIGHTIAHGKDKSHGEWRSETVESIAAAGGKDKGFFDAFDQPKSLLIHYLVQVLSTGKADPQPAAWQEQVDISKTGLTVKDVLDDPGMKAAEASRLNFEKVGWPKDKGPIATEEMSAQMKCKLSGTKRKAMKPILTKVLYGRMPLDDAAEEVVADIPDAVPQANVWDAMAKHAAVAWCQAVRLQGSDGGLWDGDWAGQTLKDGRVYQEAYKSTWVSYGARPESVTKYQFRAAAEWFAELYAAYYMGWLDKKHWIGKLKMPGQEI